MTGTVERTCMVTAGSIHFFDPPRRLPNVVGYFAKGAVANHHPGATRPVMIEPDEPAVAVFRVEVWPFARQDVGMQVDLHWRTGTVTDSTASIAVST